MSKLVALADRTAVLFLGVAAGAAIGFAFGRSGEHAPERAVGEPAHSAGAVAPPPAVRGDAAGFECALPFQQHLLDTIAAGKPVTVGVFGDSFGDGVWSALYRLLPAQEHFRVIKYSQQATGFTRYSRLNLEEHTQAQLAADGPVDVAVISFGANDTQGVYSGGHAAALMSPEWQRVIGARVDRFVALMRAKGAMVYWVGLPKMRKASFDDDIASMNDFYTARMKALRVPFIDIKPLTVDDAGEFALYMPDPVSHERRLLRANDGVHMSMNGYVVITRALADRIKAYVRAAKVMAGVGEAVPAAVVRVAAPEGAKSERPAQKGERDERHERSRGSGERDRRDKPHRPTRDRDDADQAARPKRDDADGPTRAHDNGDRQRPSPSEKRDGESRDRPAKPAGDAKPRGGGEAKPAEAKAGETKPAAGERRRSEALDKPGEPKSRPSETKSRAPETKLHSTETKPHASETKPRSTKTDPKPAKKKPRAEDGRAKPDDAPAKRRHRDEAAPAGEGNSQ